MFYLTTHSTHFIYSYMASNIWLRTILIVREKTCWRHISYSFQLTARVLLYAPSHRQDSTYHSLCYTSRGALAGTRKSLMCRSDDPSHHERMLLPQSYISLLGAYNAILTDIYDFCRFNLTIIPHFIFELLSVCNDTRYASWAWK